MADFDFDVAVIGAGLAGLVGALQLGKNGQRVVVLERQNRVGGLCGVDEYKECHFAIACNDFGRGMIELLNKLGVKTGFEAKETHVFYRNEVLKAPLDGTFLLKLARSPLQTARLLYGILRSRRDQSVTTLGEFTRRFLPEGRIRDISEIPAYLMGTAPEDFALSYLRYESEYGYNYNEPGVPVGGPQQLANDLLARCGELGITVATGWEVEKCERYSGGYLVGSREEQISARRLVDTRERTKAYPESVKRGLELCQMRLVLDGYDGFDSKVHTYLYYPEGGAKAMRTLDSGAWAEDFPFHLFRNDYQQPAGLQAVNIYFYLPRGIREVSEERTDWLSGRILRRAERLIPGFSECLKHWQLFTPHAFENKFGMSPRVMPFVWQGEKPANFDPESGCYYAGHTVYPPGDHAGAAVLSGYTVANLILEGNAI